MKKLALFIILIIYCTVNIYSQPLFDAVKNNEYSKVKELIDKGENINIYDENNASLLMWAVNSGDIGLVKLLVEKGADFTKKGAIYTEDGSSYYGNLLGLAAGLDKVEILKYLIEVCKIDIEDKEFVSETNLENGWTALQWAAYAGNDDAVEYLISKGANINANHTSDAATPLLYAIQNGKYSTAEILIDTGADVNLGNADGWYPIHFACTTRMYKILEKLINAGADVNTKAPDGYNSLVLCAYYYYYSSCKMLLENGANTTIKDKNGYSALDYAKMYNYNLIYQLMLNPEFEPEINNQNLGELINISVDYYFSEKYSETTELLEQILPMIKTAYGENDTTYYGILLSYAAYCYDVLENYSSAETYYLKTIDVYKKLNSKSLMLVYTLYYLAEMYDKSGNNEKAEEYYLETLDFYKNIYSENSSEYGIYLITLIDFYNEINDFDKAEIYHLKYIETVKNYLGENDISYSFSLSYIADFYYSNGYYSKAEEYYLKASEAAAKTKGSNSDDNIVALNDLALIYSKNSKYTLAEEKYTESLEIQKNLLGLNSIEVAETQFDLAGLYSDMGYFEKSENIYLEGINILDNLNEQNSEIYISALNGLAIIYQTNGDYVKAEELFLKAITTGESNNEIRPIDYAVCIANLAELNRLRGNYEESEKLNLEVLEIIKNILTENCDEYANTLNNLGLLYYNKADYQKTETCLLQAKEIRKNVLGEKHPDYAVTLNNLGLLYQTLGNYQKAYELFSEALLIRENTIGINHPAYAVSLCNLGLLYTYATDYESAIALFSEAVRIQEENVSEKNPNLATYYDNLAFCYIQTNNFEEAEKYNLKALEIKKEKLGTEHLNYAVSLNNLAKIYISNKKYKDAEKVLLESVEINKNQVGTQNLNYSVTLADLALMYIKSEQYKKAENIVTEANNIFNFLITQSSKYMSEKELEMYVFNKVEVYFGVFNSYAYLHFDENTELNKMLYNNALTQKSSILNTSMAMRKEILSSENQDLKNLYSEFIENHKILAALYAQPIENRELDADSLENITNTIEKQIYASLDGFENTQGFDVKKWTDIQNSLNEDEAAIEFIDFDFFDKDFTDSIYYCALVLTKEMKVPEIVFLFEENQLDTLLFIDESTDEYKYIRKLYSYNELGESINNLIWNPFDNLLENISTVYISPSGILNKIAFDAIPTSSKTLLSDKYSIKYVTSTANIITKNELYSSEIEKIALFGDINYDVDTLIMKEIAQNYKIEDETAAARSLNYLENNVSRGGVWQYLSGTKEEIYEIKNIFEKYNFIPQLFTQNEASEELFKSFSNSSPSLIHFATHGFYFPYVDENKETYEFLGQEIQYIFSENPLLRSGIILAGGNNIWSNIEIPQNVEDGVLSAYEISHLNMSGTKLVVLSACQTGLGDVYGSEGVFGLRRALKMSGVDFIVMSLWKVPDEQTKELMTEFYRNFASGKEIRTAFKDAQNFMKEKYKSVPGAAYAWAAFVLIE